MVRHRSNRSIALMQLDRSSQACIRIFRISSATTTRPVCALVVAAREIPVMIIFLFSSHQTWLVLFSDRFAQHLNGPGNGNFLFVTMQDHSPRALDEDNQCRVAAFCCCNDYPGAVVHSAKLCRNGAVGGVAVTLVGHR